MTPKYKLIYFNTYGRAEPLRYIFAYAGQDYVYEIIEKENWPKLKPNTPYGQLPVLEVDGKPAAQTTAIARYLAKQFNIQGKDDWEILQADSLVEALADYRACAKRLYTEQNPEKIAEIKKERAKYLEKFDTILSSNPSGVLVGSEITWADLVFAAVLSGRQDDLEDRSTALTNLIDKINNIPNIKSWLQARSMWIRKIIK
uniref:glutathione transferase n=1 Tax=Dendroctonus armandi TaxID=77159 RepID=A0A5P9JXC5_9CUCU|nr:glutathione S-transferase GSTs6 [Dendroctonus armandi]